MLVAAVLTSVTLAAGPAATASVALLATAIVARRRRIRRSRDTRCEAESLAAALEVLVGELRVGSHPAHALSVAAGESSGGVSAALGAIAASARLGADVAGGLLKAAGRSSVPQYWTRIAICWQLATDHGLPIALLIHTAYQDITHRQRFVDRVDAGLSGARATAVVLGGLPLLGVLFGQFVGAQPLRFLLGDGGWILVVGVALQCAGILWSDRIAHRAAL